MKSIFVLLVALIITGCTVKFDNSPTQTPSNTNQLIVYSPVITERACVNGKSMIQVKFVTNEGGYDQQADFASWVYEYTDVYQSSVKVC
jgi:hypothetical protein